MPLTIKLWATGDKCVAVFTVVGLFGVCGIYAGSFWYFIPLKCGCHMETEKIYSLCGETEKKKRATNALDMTPVIVVFLKSHARLTVKTFFSFTLLFS